MDIVSIIRREDGKHKGLGLGWLLAIALCGGILLFAAIGYLLAWRIKMRAQPCTTRVYANTDGIEEGDHTPHGPSRTASTNVLSKRRFHVSESSFSRLSSRLSMNSMLPHVLPPAPKYETRPRSRSWVDEEAIHGPKVQRRSLRDSWIGGMESWLAKSPTIPNLESQAEKGEAKGEEMEEEEQQQQPQQPQQPPQHQEIKVQKRQSKATTDDQSGEQLAAEQLTRGRPRAIGQQQQQKIEGSATESDLRDILRMTEQRLRDGTSRSPTKTPRSSPPKASPSKTPRSYRTPSSSKTTVRGTPSPSKKSVQAGTPATVRTVQSRNASVSSIGSAANSLIRAATEELELPDRQPSQRSLRAQSRELSQQDVRQASPQRRRSDSLESSGSSSLSTLYSVGDSDSESEESQEEHTTTQTPARQGGDDPFVTSTPQQKRQMLVRKATWETRQLTGPRPFGRNNSRRVSEDGIDETAVPAPLRTISTNSRVSRNSRDGKQSPTKLTTVVLSPPKKAQSEDVKPKTSSPEANKRMSLSEAPSKASVASESSYTDVTVSDDDSASQCTEKADELPGHRRARSSVSSFSTPTKSINKDVDLSSSPLDEREVLSMLMDTSRPRRKLPTPPTCIMVNGEMVGPTALSPRPKSKERPSPSRRASTGSDSSSGSDYEKESLATTAEDRPTELPSLLSVTNALGAAHSVGSTVAELRRMNSVVSSYSVASMASTVFGEGLTESPTLPALRGGGFSPTRSNPKLTTSGTQNYLNLGKKNSQRMKKEQQQQQQQGYRRHQRSISAISVLSDDQENETEKVLEKENQGLGIRTRSVRFAVPPPRREGRQSPTSGPASTSSPKAKGDMSPEERKRAKQAQRASVESLGLYDADGFLKSSPDAKTGRLRM